MSIDITPPLKGFTTNPEVRDVAPNDNFCVYNFKTRVWEQYTWQQGSLVEVMKLYAWPENTPLRTISKHRFCSARLFRGEDGQLRLHRDGRSIVWADLCFFNHWPCPEHVRNMSVSFSWDQYGNIREY